MGDLHIAHSAQLLALQVSFSALCDVAVRVHWHRPACSHTLGGPGAGVPIMAVATGTDVGFELRAFTAAKPNDEVPPAAFTASFRRFVVAFLIRFAIW